MVKRLILWLLTALGLKSWVAGYEAKVAADRQEANTRETEIQQEVEDEKADVAAAPDSELPDILQQLRDNAQARRDRDSGGD